MIVSRQTRLLTLLAVLAATGLASLLLLPIETMLPTGGVPPVALRLRAAFPLVAVAIAATALGCLLAPRVALSAPVLEAIACRRPWWPFLTPALPLVIVTAAMLVAVSVTVALVSGPPSTGGPVTAASARSAISLFFVRTLYGGIVEELVLRWGLMSLLVSAARWLYCADEPTTPMYWSGIVLVALLMPVVHLALLQASTASVPVLVLVAALYAVPGLLLGRLFWRHGLEAAMLAHAAGQVFAFLIGY